MKEYKTQQIRNIAILGHQGSGKTTLAESLCFVAKNISKKGEVERKSSISDFLLEEQNKLSSFSSSIIPVEYKDYKFNFIDCPGNDEFKDDIEEVLKIVKGAILVLDAQKGIEPLTSTYYKLLKRNHIPTIIFLNKMDKPNIKYEDLVEDLRANLGSNVTPFVLPLGKEDSFDGYVDLVDLIAVQFEEGKAIESNIYEDKKPRVESLRATLFETVAQTSEDLMEKFFNGVPITHTELVEGLRVAVMNGELIPILIGSSTKDIAISTLLDMLGYFLPNPQELGSVTGHDLNNREIKRFTSDDISLSGYVFKTQYDQFLGFVNYVKIFSGTLKVGDEFYVASLDTTKKVVNLSVPRGKNLIPIDIAHAGDIIALTKLDLQTGDSISSSKNIFIYPNKIRGDRMYYVSIKPKNRNDEDKISSSLQKLNVEDPSFHLLRNEDTKQLLLGGNGLAHITYILERLKNLFKVEVDIENQKIFYKETITKKDTGHGKHKKQSGGAGQFGEVYIRFEPSNLDFEFASEVTGGSVSKAYFPAVEKGLIETFKKGPLAGYPLINVKSILYDGSEHDVDSNEISFKMAANLAFKDATSRLGLTILEPIVKLSVKVKDIYIGDILGDATKRRGKITSTSIKESGYQVIEFVCPEAEITNYAIDLRALTQGSGEFSRSFVGYEQVPFVNQEKIIKEAKQE